jgi:hypothetical protein
MRRKIWKIAKWFFGTILSLCLLVTLLLYVFKDDIINYVVGEVNKNLNAKVTVSKIDVTFWRTFPNLSVDFDNVFISDALPNSTKADTLLYSDQIRLKFNVGDIWRKEYKVKKIEIRPGTVQLKIDSLGKVNYNILKENKDAAETKFNLNLESVHFEHVRFAYLNGATGQQYTTLVKDLELEGRFTEAQFTLHAKSQLQIYQLKSDQVTLLSNKPCDFDLSILVDQQKNTFEIPNATIFLARLPFSLQGKITPKSLKFDIRARQLKLQDVANNLATSQTEHIHTYQGQGFFNFALAIQGQNQTNEAPTMVCDFDIRNGSLREPSQNLRFSNIQLKGKYSNKDGKRNEFLKLWNLKFNTVSGPFQGEVLLTNFAAPYLQGKAKGRLDLASIHGLFRLPYIDQIHGNLDINSQFAVQTLPQPNAETAYDIRSCQAQLGLEQINVSLLEDSRTFKSLNGRVNILEDEAALENISVVIGRSDFRLNGVFQQLSDYFRKTGKLVSHVDLASNFIDIADLSSTHVSVQPAVVTERANVLPDDVEGKVQLSIGQLKYGTHAFNHLRSGLDVGSRLLTFRQLSVENAQAEIRGNLSIEETGPEFLLLKSELVSENIYFKNLFREWNNFDQTVISENNISGKAHVDMSFQAPFDLRSGIRKAGILSRIHVKIVDGRLKDVSAFKSITESLKKSSVRLILKAKNINYLEQKLLDLKFETLENTLLIQNGRLEIPLMSIKSNALDIETYGYHTFENQIDYHFEFRFRDLLTKKADTEFGEVIDDGTGMHIFMRMYGSLDNPVIEWDENAKKQQVKENREAAKQEAMSILKSEFGWRKGDTTIGTYKPVKEQKEVLEMDFGDPKQEEEFTAPKKEDSKLKKGIKDKLNKIKEASKPKELEFEVE